VDSDEIAFGFSGNLPAFKRVVPRAKNYVDLGIDPYAADFADRLRATMGAASRIHFDLSGMRMLNTADGVLIGPAHLNPSGSTNWELRTLWDDPALRAKTTFYRDGQILSVEEVLQLE
jgi:hypothetical protein